MTYDEKDDGITSPTSKNGGKSAQKKKPTSPAKDKKENKDNKKPVGDKKKKDINAFLADLDLKKTENNVLATFNISFDSILDCSSYKIEKLFTKELPIPQYVVDEFEGNLDGNSNGKGANSKGKNGDRNDKKNKQPVKNEPAGKGILRFY